MEMDRREQIQFLGFFGILRESFNIIFLQKKIFTQITLAFILPLSLTLLAHIQISQFLFIHLTSDQDALDRAAVGSARYANLSSTISSEWTAFFLFKAAYFTSLLILSLLSTSAVVHTVSGIYTGGSSSNEITFKKLMIAAAVPKVWKRLAATFLWSFAVLVFYNIASATAIFLLAEFLGIGGATIIVTLAIPYFLGFVYITLLWHLASAVSVLENRYGIGAVIKSKALIEGKMPTAAAIFLSLCLCFFGIQIIFEFGSLLPRWWWLRTEARIVIGIVCLLMLMTVVLFGLVAQTVVYFVCKSHHRECIQDLDHMEAAYLGDYVSLINYKDIQLGQCHV